MESACMRLVVAAATLLLSSGIAFAQGSGVTLQKVADYQLPGDTSRWDYQSIDSQSYRLFIAHLGAGEVVVYDTQRAAVVGTVHGIAGVHGVMAVPELRRVYASATDGSRSR